MLSSLFAAKRAQRQLASMPIHTERNTGQSSIPIDTRSDPSWQPKWRSEACSTRTKNSRRPAQDFIGYREFFDLDYAMPKQREAGVTLSLASNGGEVDWIARELLQVSTGDALKFLNDEYLEIRDRYPGEFALMANAHAIEEGCRPIVEEMISQGGAKAIAVSSSYGDGSDRAFLDSPKAEWLGVCGSQ
jgi:hypothetical protein